MEQGRLEIIKSITIIDARDKRIVDELIAEVEYLQAKVRASSIVIESCLEHRRELIGVCEIALPFLIDSDAVYKISNEEYRLIVIEPFNKALARAKGED